MSDSKIWSLDVVGVQKLHVICPIKDDAIKGGSHFNKNLHSNICNAIIFSYYGNVSEVFQILQVLNHKTRAYCYHMNKVDYGLRNFLVKMPRGYQHFDVYTKKIINQLANERKEEKLYTIEEPKNIQIHGCLYGDYTGEWSGEHPHGEGTFVSKLGGTTKGTLRYGRWDGYCKCLIFSLISRLDIWTGRNGDKIIG